ncbi:thiamine-phosphate kinase [Breoghania sp.]|uniref:thiamine-phosphate kinase n=1 Tax=Breoghania sp. TaxID=2065378 RepID=UPI002AA78249|nr:thiamine-phosphate kinase [Breoghania sp.]
MGDGDGKGGGIGEFELIERYLAPLATHPGSVGLVDDAAVLTPPEGCDLVMTKDALAEGVHFLAEDHPSAIARKALRVNLSDLAAKGARPLGYLLGLGLAPGWDEAWLADFCSGLEADQQAYDFPLLGGDTIKVAAGPVLSVTAIGTVPRATAVRRFPARVGDHLYVTGTIGDAALGLALRFDPSKGEAWGLEEAERAHLLDRYLLPQPRTEGAEAVRCHARACMDVSDGLVADLGKMLGASGAGIGADVLLEAVPFSNAAQKAVEADPAALVTALTGGDDYELLASVAPEDALAFEHAMLSAGLHPSRIGTVREGAGVTYLKMGKRIAFAGSGGYTHF